MGEFELIVLATVKRLADGAYGVAILKDLEQRSGRSYSIGAIYTTLDRLEKKGLVKSRVGEPSAKRGGRAKRYYEIQAQGIEKMNESWSLMQAVIGDLVWRKDVVRN